MCAARGTRDGRAAPSAAAVLGALVLLAGCARAPTPPPADTCAPESAAAGWREPVVRHGGRAVGFHAMIDTLAAQRVVLVGEQHDRYDHHLLQLEIVCRLGRRWSELAVGAEFFQQPFQPALDAWVAGEGSVEDLLRASEWFERWGLDFRLYAPILAHARRAGVPVVALNLPGEITRAVGRGGFEALDPAERARLPADVEAPDDAYRERLRDVFEQHPERARGRFEHFVQVQVLWDAGMAARAAEHLRAHPGRRMVVLAGSGHVAPAGAVPDRLARRLAAPMAIVVPAAAGAGGPGRGDAGAAASVARFVFEGERMDPPPAGRLGVLLDEAGPGVRVTGFGDDSAARAAGVRESDRIVAVDGRPVERFADVRLALWSHAPGARVRLRVRHGSGDGDGDERLYEVTLR